jgi:adenylate cyclase
MRLKRYLASVWNGVTIAGLLVLVNVFLLQISQVAAIENLGNLVFDAFIRAKPRDYTPVPVRIVDIDEESLRRQGQWPWPRTEMERLLGKLTDAGVATIALDIVFSEPDRTSPPAVAEWMARSGVDPAAVAALRRLPDNDALFAASLGAMPVVNGYFLTQDPRRVQVVPKAGIAISGSLPDRTLATYSNAVMPLAALDEAAVGRGFLTLTGDSDGIVRRAPLLALQGDQIQPALSLEALRVAQGAGSIMVKSSDGSGNFAAGVAPGVVSLKVGEFEVPTTRSGELWMYYTEPRPERVIPAWKVLEGKLSPEQLASELQGAIVFVGTGAIGLRDLIATPVSQRELGVMVHAQAVEQMILGEFLTRPDWAPGLERALVLLIGLVLLLLLPRLGAMRGALLGLMLVGAVLGGSWLAFTRQRFLLDPTYPILAMIAVYLTVTSLTYYREERARSYIHKAFDRYLSPELVKRIASDPRQLELGGEERNMTVLFCDIRSFSRISEQLDPKSIIRFLIGFLTPMCDILLARKATIDKFIGDAILAFWNAPLDDPDHHENAARGALEMIERLKGLNAEMPGKADQPWPGDVAIGIGLNAGPCCVGNMGSAQRLSYSLIGDTVNLASRIEGLTKYYGVSIAVGVSLRQALPHFALVELDRVRVVGRDAPEEVWALIGDEVLARNPRFAEFAAAHAAMLEAYRTMAWDAAERLLDELRQTAPDFGLSKHHGLYQERIATLRASDLPEDWDGVFTAQEK